MIPDKKNVTLFCYGLSFGVYTIIFFWGMFGEHFGSYFGYGLVSFYLVIPITSFTMSLILNAKNAYLKWLYPVYFGAFGLAIPVIVFPRMVWDVWPFCVIPALAGLGIGLLIRKKRS